MKKLILVVLAVLGITFTTALPAYAATTAPIPCQPGNTACSVGSRPDPASLGKDCTVDKCDIINLYVDPFIKFLTIIVGIVVTIAIIIGGIQYSMSAGDPQKAASAKGHIRAAIIALVAYFLLYAFIQFLTPGSGLGQG